MSDLASDFVADDLSAFRYELPGTAGDFVNVICVWFLSGGVSLKREHFDGRKELTRNAGQDLLLVVFESVAEDKQIVRIIPNQLDCF